MVRNRRQCSLCVIAVGDGGEAAKIHSLYVIGVVRVVSGQGIQRGKVLCAVPFTAGGERKVETHSFSKIMQN